MNILKEFGNFHVVGFPQNSFGLGLTFECCVRVVFSVVHKGFFLWLVYIYL